MENSKNFKILSLDGGGIRGMLTATLLVTLENELKAINPEHTLTNCFDFFAGTSTGSIIACGLANGMTATQILGFYNEHGQTIFKELDLKKFSNVWPEVWRRIKEKDPSLPLFEEEGLESVLKKPNIFPETLLFKDLPKPTLVTSYDTYNREAVIFVSQGKNAQNPDDKYKARYATLPVWQVCRSSSAAPVAFAGYLLKDKAYLDALTEYERPDNERIRRGDLTKDVTKTPLSLGLPQEECIPLIDGGVVANNPALCAIAEAIENGKPLDKIFVASFGTGQVNRRISAEEATTWGGFDWVNIHNQIPLMDVFSDGSSDVTDYTAKKLLKDNYKRIQPVITSDISTFQADEANLTALSRAADHYLNHCGGKERLKKLAQQLVNA
ncbi:patatin-like phospholipase family protein [Microcystis aeruginosa CS-558/01A06]|uniref:Patatin-like phospholipase family protein n=1 Tax=Microcystis aeruginosa BLCC-F108 TaxID=2755317 RepID=A0A841UMK1_MICAE|nr:MULTISPECIES: patatin-like phospholipase family protein [Microcystis]MBC1189457.1 patatin-like phospholipase family protein [Microcystis aeruginosa BLCC-F108]MCA2593404.1 patatin-like phospholipase family protein [Microcystis sp. M31BS1]MDB9407685.1 patatin-like phospholipase family protein [Microcystis aeruginosa CS-558/01A06]